jgi:membrane protein YdbS with pleckstrin-like domain
MNPTELVAKSSGLALERVDESTYVIRVERQFEGSIIEWPFIICLGLFAVVFGGMAIWILIKSWRHAIGVGIGMFVWFGMMACVGGVGAILEWRYARVRWQGQVLEIDLQRGILTVLRGNRTRRTIPFSAIEAVGLGFASAKWGPNRHAVLLSLRVRTPTRDVVFQGHEDFCIRLHWLGYPMSTQLAEITSVGKAISEIMKVPFTQGI